MGINMKPSFNAERKTTMPPDINSVGLHPPVEEGLDIVGSFSSLIASTKYWYSLRWSNWGRRAAAAIHCCGSHGLPHSSINEKRFKFSDEDGFLLRLACGELIKNLKVVAKSVSRLRKKRDEPVGYIFIATNQLLNYVLL